jgi:hypothetical protein
MVSGLAVAAASMSEKQLDGAVRRLMNDLGLAPFAFHPYGAGRYRAGYPDWTIAGDRGLLFRELKTERGRLTAAQTAWIERLRALGLDADVWRPRDLHAGRIGRELAAISALVGRAC